MRLEKIGTGKNAKEVAAFEYTSKTKGLNWNVKEETEVTTLGEANAEAKTTKNGDGYIRLTIGGMVYAQFEANFMNAFVKANDLHPKEGGAVNIPLDAAFKLTPDGAEFRVN